MRHADFSRYVRFIYSKHFGLALPPWHCNPSRQDGRNRVTDAGREESEMGICTKIGIVGMGHVGAHVANSLVLQGIADELYMTEICSGERDRSRKLAAEVQDLGDSLAFCPHNVALHNCGDDYAQLAQCDVIVNCAGDVSLSSKDRDGELFFTTDTAKTFIKTIADAGFHGIWITIANPCDVVATEIWKESGMDPRRIIGTGTALDSSRLKYVLSRVTGYDQHSITAYMLGEHGNSQFAAWSNVYFGGKPLSQLAVEQPERFAFDYAELEAEARKGGLSRTPASSAPSSQWPTPRADSCARSSRTSITSPHAPRCSPANMARRASSSHCRAWWAPTAWRRSCTSICPTRRSTNSTRAAHT